MKYKILIDSGHMVISNGNLYDIATCLSYRRCDKPTCSPLQNGGLRGYEGGRVEKSRGMTDVRI